MEKLPVYKMSIENSEEGLTSISLVEFPAIERNFVTFSANKPVKFQINDEEKRIVTGALLLADTPIYRNENGEEYYIVIEKPEVFKTAQKFFKDGVQNSVNAEHTKNFFSGITLFESFIVDESRGISAPDPELYGTIPEGSWVGSFFVESDEVWEEIKAGTFKGFSVEGWYSLEKISLTKEKTDVEEIAEILELIEEIEKAY